jgi:hypothetical protein
VSSGTGGPSVWSTRTAGAMRSRAARSRTRRPHGSATGARSSASTARSWSRRALAAVDDLLREGRWENYLHGRLRERGFEFWSDPEATLEHAKDFGFFEFCSQRYHYSRSYAGTRNGHLGWKRAAYAVGTPALVPLLYARIARNVLARGRHRRELLAATPLMLLYTAVWAFGEVVGYTFGGGRSLLKVR